MDYFSSKVFLTPEEELVPPIGKDLVSGSGGDDGKQGGELPEKKVPPPVSTTFYQVVSHILKSDIVIYCN